MRELNSAELSTVSGGFFFHKSCVKPVAPKCGCTNPLELALGFLGGAIKLLCTGERSVSTNPDCTPVTPPEELR